MDHIPQVPHISFDRKFCYSLCLDRQANWWEAGHVTSLPPVKYLVQSKINESKTQTMIFNYTKNYQFTTRTQLKNVNVDVVPETKLLGTHITNDLKCDKNTYELIKNANARMQLLRKIKSFNAPLENLKLVYITFIKSLFRTIMCSVEFND